MKTGLATRRTFLKSTAAAALATPALAQSGPVVLRMSSWLPQASLIVGGLVLSWVDLVSRVTQGRVTVELLDKPLGPPPAHLELLQTGAADVAYTLHGYSGESAFLRARIGQFAFLGDAYKASHSYSAVYQDLLNAQEEHEGVKLLGVFQHGPGVLMLKDKQITGPEDFRGLKIRHSGGFIQKLLTKLGAEPIAMSPFAVAENMANGTIDGVAFPYEAGPAFNVVDQVTSVSELEGGYYNASWFLGVSPAAWQRISPADQVAIEEASKASLHILASKVFDLADRLGKEQLQSRGIPINGAAELSPIGNAVRVAAEEFETAWVDEVAGQGYDGTAALEAMRASRLDLSTEAMPDIAD